MAGQDIILTGLLNLVFNNITFDNSLIAFAKPSREELMEQLKMEHFVVATMNNFPLSYAMQENGTFRGDGAAFVIMQLLQNKFQFNYTLVVPEDDIMGNERAGLFGYLNTGKADIAAAFLPVVREGQNLIQYSRNLDSGDWVVLMRRPKESAKGSGILAPFTFGVWMLTLMTLIVMAPIIYVIIRIRQHLCPDDGMNKVYSIPGLFWFIYGGILKQGSVLSPLSNSARLLFATWWIFIIIWTAFYTANLTAFMTLSQFTLPIEKPEDIMSYKWVTRRGNAMEHAAMDDSEAHARVEQAEFVMMNNTDILENLVMKKNYLFLQEQPIVDFLMWQAYLERYKLGLLETERCVFVSTTWPVLTRARAFAYSKKFPYSELFDYTLQHMVEAGIIRYLLEFGLPTAKVCPLNLNSRERQLRNTDLLTTYELIFIGFGCGVIALICEMFIGRKWQVFRERKKKSNKFINNNDYDEKPGLGKDKDDYFTPPPPSYQTLFGQRNVPKKTVNGRDYYIYKSKDGDTRLVPIRTPSALLFQYTN